MEGLCFMLICIAAIFGYQYGKFVGNVKIKDDSKFLSDCCGAIVYEKTTAGCLNCGNECKIKKR